MTLGEVEGPEDTDHVRPVWLVRVAILVPCALLVGSASTAWLSSPIKSGLDLAVIVSLVCLYVIVRWTFFMGVRKNGQSMVVTGALWSRRIPLAQIERVTDFHTSSCGGARDRDCGCSHLSWPSPLRKARWRSWRNETVGRLHEFVSGWSRSV
jgi:hypothetical protein